MKDRPDLVDAERMRVWRIFNLTFCQSPAHEQDYYPEITGICPPSERYCRPVPRRIGILPRRPDGRGGASVVRRQDAAVNRTEDFQCLLL